MSSSAATPSAPSSKAPGSDSGSSLEPSPASTSGESATSNAGDSPQTPGGRNNEGVLLTGVAKLSINDGKLSAVERYSPPFVRKGAKSTVEDPFTSISPRRCSGQVTPTDPKSKARAAKSDNWRSGSSSGSSSTGKPSPSPSRYLVTKSGSNLFVKQYDSEDSAATFYQTVTAEDAQGLFPPACCVFVANLLQSETDEALEVAVTQVFREFGSVWVKIRRDAKHMPFAFCQYSTPEHAEHAIREGRGRLIKGRPCRCEKAKAHRLFFMERKYGPSITTDEVTQLLQGFGKLEMIRPAHAFELAQLNLNEGVMVQFQMYDDGQAALQAYRNHEVYKMQSMANMCSLARGSQYGGSSDPAARQYLDTYEVDKRSVFIGNLPVETQELDLQQKFEKYGPIRRVTLHKNESLVDANQKHCFAFVEFLSASAVPMAIDDMNGSSFLDKTIRVSQKDSEGAKKRRPRQAGAAPAVSYQSPLHHSVGQQPFSPMTHSSPQGYGSPYSYSYGGPYYGYPSTGYYADAQNQFYPTPSYSYSPFYAYTGSPSYASGNSSMVDAATAATGSTAQPYYGYYPQYPAPPSPYWGFSGPTTQQPAYYPPAYSPPTTASSITIQEDRSVTPTPTGHTATAESPLESQ